MTLTWTSVPGHLEAVGCRAVYTINTIGPLTRYHLQATGHDTPVGGVA